MSETLEGLKGRLGTLKRALESKWLRADAMKTKMMISNENAVKASCSNRRRPDCLCFCRKGRALVPMPVLQVLSR